MKYEIKNRFSRKVQFTAEIECKDDAPESKKIGLAVKWALKNGADLWGADLRDADLRRADLRDAVLRGARLRDADLEGADLWGADLRDAYLLGACVRGADLEDADLRGADLRGADLRAAYLRDVDLRGADLRGADLRGADLRDARWGAAPRIENIHQAVYDACTQSDRSLDMRDWHTCDTTHCRAGWVVTLAGEEGKELESRIGTPAAALAIYATSDPGYFSRDGIPDFYCDNETALADMKRLADLERA